MSYFLFRFFSYTFFLFANLAISYLSVLHLFGLHQQSFERYLWQIPVYLFVYFLNKLFSARTVSSREFVETLKANIMALLLIVLAMFVVKLGSIYSRRVVLLFFLLNTLIPIYMYLYKRLFMRFSFLREPVIAVCDENGEKNIRNWFVRDNAFGFDVEKTIRVDNSFNGIVDSIEAMLKNSNYYALIIAIGTQKASRVFYLIDRLQPAVKRIIIIPSLAKVPLVNVEIVSSINNKGLALFVSNNLLNPVHRTVKELTDRFFSLALVVLFAPLFTLLYLFVCIDTGCHPIFTQERIGFGGRSFRMFKFRTMRLDAQERLNELLEKDEKARREWEKNFKLKNDPRVTKIGRFLRKTSLDELPQLINVLKGEMSLVGPRPIIRDEIAKYGEYFEYYKLVKPGITGLWQVSGRNDLEYDERVRMDVWYVRNWSLELDFIILLKTLGSVITGKGSY